jgi:pyridoxal phosphate enzyme (YggS family)
MMKVAALDPSEVAERLAVVRQRIVGVGGDLDRITIVAVAKGFGPEAVDAAASNGLVDFGENYAQSLLAKVSAGAGGATARWHFIGVVQRNKVKALAPVVSLWEAVDRVAAGRSIADHAPGAKVLVEVNMSGEPTKSGCPSNEAAQLVDELATMGLDVRGLMTVAPAGPPEGARASFAGLSALADRLDLAERSMGMSGDLEVAVQEGATIVRLGTALFGPRSDNADLRR